MNKPELITLREQIKKQYYETFDAFRDFCSSDYCEVLNFSSNYEEETYQFFATYLDGEEYDELDAEIQNEFWFSDGAARRRFDLFRKKGGLLNQLSLIITDLINGREENKYDGYDDWSSRWSKDDISRLVQESEAVIAEEKAFIEMAEKGMQLIDDIQED